MRSKKLLARSAGFLTILCIGLTAACGALRAPSNVASGASTQTPTPSGYVAYVSADLKYSFEHPANWFQLPVSHYGSVYGNDWVNENIGSPEQLSPNGLWLYVDVDVQPTRSCNLVGTPQPEVSSAPITIDAESATVYSGAGGLGVYLAHNNWCYSIAFIAASAQDLSQHRAEIDHILSSFRFNR